MNRIRKLVVILIFSTVFTIVYTLDVMADSTVINKESEVEGNTTEEVDNAVDEDRSLEEDESNDQTVFTSSDRYFKVVSDRLPVYMKETDELVIIGYLFKGEVYERQGGNYQWHYIKYGSQQGYVDKQLTEPAESISFIKDTTNGNMGQKGYLEIKKNTRVYYKPNGELHPISIVTIGSRYPVIKSYHQWYVINVAGRLGYVSKSHVEFSSYNLVNPKQLYTYEKLEHDLQTLQKAHGDLIKLKVIGQSVEGRNIYALKLGKGNKEVFINASHHAREHLTTNLVMEMIDTYARGYQYEELLGSYNIKKILDRTSIWFVPMVNPDGVTLVQKGHKGVKASNEVLRINGGSTDFSAWKANIRGVDLNRQYPAGWDTIINNPGRPAPLNYKGSAPLSEPEAKAIYDFTLAHSFKASISYHSSGEILYWYYYQNAVNMEKDRAIAKQIGHITGYSLVKPKKFHSGGGYTDWFILSQQRPGFTPEISSYIGPKPVPLGNFDTIWRQNSTLYKCQR